MGDGTTEDEAEFGATGATVSSVERGRTPLGPPLLRGEVTGLVVLGSEGVRERYAPIRSGGFGSSDFGGLGNQGFHLIDDGVPGLLLGLLQALVGPLRVVFG